MAHQKFNFVLTRVTRLGISKKEMCCPFMFSNTFHLLNVIYINIIHRTSLSSINKTMIPTAVGKGLIHNHTGLFLKYIHDLIANLGFIYTAELH